MYEEMFVFRFFPHLVFPKELLRSVTTTFRIRHLTLISALICQLLCCDLFFIIKHVSVKRNCKNCISICMDQSLLINLDDAFLAHRGLDGVLITSNIKVIGSLVAKYTSCLAVNSL